ncbi:cell wall hydrolase [Azospirillum halopraeferens]|uniref:cell wall hydrolase n=1 Tax=Azospirillum halopraeferens TaxID=34010 RepID=UPI0004247C49|nr:cell wall hydrolase [Azospirillum halopraeferens]
MSRRLIPVPTPSPIPAAAPPPVPPVPPPGLPAAPAAGGPVDAAVDTLARTLWGEARGEPVRGIEAVAAVVVNRVRRAERRGGLWWGNDIIAVCRKPRQFSCWNADDPNRPKLLAVTAADPVFATCLRVARRAVAGLLPDPTGGATHYHRIGITPSWSIGHAPCAEIGRHVFYDTVA